MDKYHKIALRNTLISNNNDKLDNSFFSIDCNHLFVVMRYLFTVIPNGSNS